MAFKLLFNTFTIKFIKVLHVTNNYIHSLLLKTTYFSLSVPISLSFWLQTNACHLVDVKHVRPSPLSHLCPAQPPACLPLWAKSAINDLELLPLHTPPAQLALGPRGLNKWASFMHLIISDCTDRGFCFLFIHFDVAVLAGLCWAIGQAEVVKWKAETSTEWEEVLVSPVRNEALQVLP